MRSLIALALCTLTHAGCAETSPLFDGGSSERDHQVGDHRVGDHQVDDQASHGALDLGSTEGQRRDSVVMDTRASDTAATDSLLSDSTASDSKLSDTTARDIVITDGQPPVCLRPVDTHSPLPAVTASKRRLVQGGTTWLPSGEIANIEWSSIWRMHDHWSEVDPGYPSDPCQTISANLPLIEGYPMGLWCYYDQLSDPAKIEQAVALLDRRFANLAAAQVNWVLLFVDTPHLLSSTFPSYLQTETSQVSGALGEVFNVLSLPVRGMTTAVNRVMIYYFREALRLGRKHGVKIVLQPFDTYWMMRYFNEMRRAHHGATSDLPRIKDFCTSIEADDSRCDFGSASYPTLQGSYKGQLFPAVYYHPTVNPDHLLEEESSLRFMESRYELLWAVAKGKAPAPNPGCPAQSFDGEDYSDVVLGVDLLNEVDNSYYPSATDNAGNEAVLQAFLLRMQGFWDQLEAYYGGPRTGASLFRYASTADAMGRWPALHGSNSYSALRNQTLSGTSARMSDWAAPHVYHDPSISVLENVPLMIQYISDAIGAHLHYTTHPLAIRPLIDTETGPINRMFFELPAQTIAQGWTTAAEKTQLASGAKIPADRDYFRASLYAHVISGSLAMPLRWPFINPHLLPDEFLDEQSRAQTLLSQTLPQTEPGLWSRFEDPRNLANTVETRVLLLDTLIPPTSDAEIAAHVANHFLTQTASGTIGITGMVTHKTDQASRYALIYGSRNSRGNNVGSWTGVQSLLLDNVLDPTVTYEAICFNPSTGAIMYVDSPVAGLYSYALTPTRNLVFLWISHQGWYEMQDFLILIRPK